MFKQGLFITPRGSAYNTYEVDETGFYRIDIVNEGAEFMLDVGEIQYSLVRRKKSYEYGNRSIYNEYNDLLREIGTVRTKGDSTKSYWEDGKFVQHTVRDDQSVNFYSEVTLVNGVFNKSLVRYKGYTIATDTVGSVYGIKMEPINFFEYEEINILKTKTEQLATPYYSLSYLRLHYDIEHLYNENFYLVHTVEEARKYLKLFIESDFPLRGFDTETTGLDVCIAGEDKLVGVILAWGLHDSCYFPFRHEAFENLPIEFLKEIVDAVNEKSDISIAHNKPFDKQVIMKEGYDIHIKWDTLQLAIILDDSTNKRNSHALKDIVYQVTGKVYLELSNIFISEKLIDFSILDEELVRLYACPDATNVIVVFMELIKELPSVQNKLFEVECDLADVKAVQEFYGIRVDIKKFEQQYNNCMYILDVLLRAFKALTALEDNINSPEVLRDLIYRKMKCPVLLRTKTGLASVSSNVISKLASKKAEKKHNVTQDIVDLNGKTIIKAKDLSESKYPALLILKTYREYNKLKTAFYARFERTMKTGRVFFWINQNGAASGRQSSPMHQLPTELKNCIVSDTPNHAFWGPDYSQVELRMIAFLSGEKKLIELCKDPDNDIHRVIGSLISQKEMWEITAKERSLGKRRNFGVVYDISEYGLAGQVKGPGYTKDDIKLCKELITEFFATFKWIRRFVRKNKEIVLQRGYMETAILKRRRYFKELFNPDITSRQRASYQRQANNMPVQGTSADLLKLGEVNFYNYIKMKGWDKLDESGFPLVRLMLSIHDECLISAHKSIPVEEIILMIRECMEIEVEGAPPFFVQPAYMDNWGGHSDDAVAMPIKLRDKLIDDYKLTGVSSITYDNYLDVLNNYRDECLHNYMRDLILKYGEDYTVVGEHVRDASLTFDLLDRFGDELKDFDGTQAERIVEATKYYMQNSGNLPTVEEKQSFADTNKAEDEHDKFFEEVEELVMYDKDGNIVYEDYGDEDSYEYSIYDNESLDEYVVSGEQIRVWEAADTVMLDLTYVKMEDANKIIAEVFQKKEDNGFYRVFVTYGNNTMDAGFNVEDLDFHELSKEIVQMEGGAAYYT